MPQSIALRDGGRVPCPVLDPRSVVISRQRSFDSAMLASTHRTDTGALPMYRLCLTSAVLFALGTGVSLAQDRSTPAADPIATIDSATPTALDTPATAESTSNPNAERSPAVENS